MNSAIQSMLDNYTCKTSADYKNALKEIIQEVALLGLWRSKFFEKAAFYGGSSLRILYGLDRFSEDLDFSLLTQNKQFSFGTYCKAIENELKGFGFIASIEDKAGHKQSDINSAFIKTGTLENLIMINAPEALIKSAHAKELIKLKIEIDINPPLGFGVENKYLFRPIPFSVNTYTLPDLFAGKLHAVLCRPWVSRVKGRDWYDLVWYIGQKTPVHLKHLENRMRQSGHLKKTVELTKPKLVQILLEKIQTTDFENAKKDVRPFLKDAASLSLWSKDYFNTIVKKIPSI